MHAVSSTSLVTETLPVTESVRSGTDILLQAEPYGRAMIARLLAEGAAPASAPGSSPTTTAAPVTATIPPNVVTNTEPEPWNPSPCTP
jgi:hypothetical protein